jgi:hypothetical protein
VNSYLADSLDVPLPDEGMSLIDMAESLVRSLKNNDSESAWKGEIPYIQAYMDHIQDYVASNGNNLRGFLKYWEGENPSISSPSSGNSVRVMTIHKSKGLDFPYVILPFVENITLYKAGSYWCAPDLDGTVLEGVAEGVYDVQLSGSSESTLFAEHYRKERFLQQVDNINTIYVAMTRAALGMHIISKMPPAKCLAAISDKKLPEFKDFSQILYWFVSTNKLFSDITHGVEEDNELVSADIVPSSDVSHVTGADLIDSLESAYSRWGTDDCMIICRSNQRANIYNQGVRNRILYREEELCSGDRIMIVKNNYYWVGKELRVKSGNPRSMQAPSLRERAGGEALPLSFIANGDIAVVRRVRRTRELYGFRFADVLLRFPDYDDYEMETTVLLDTLHSESPSLTKAESERLFQSVMDDYAHITTKKERYQQLRLDPHFNALQIKYAYAVTCHKAQGGQWGCIYLDQGYLPPDASVIDYYRWLYTAFTRATEQIYLVNWPKAKEE